MKRFASPIFVTRPYLPPLVDCRCGQQGAKLAPTDGSGLLDVDLCSTSNWRMSQWNPQQADCQYVIASDEWRFAL